MKNCLKMLQVKKNCRMFSFCLILPFFFFPFFLFFFFPFFFFLTHTFSPPATFWCLVKQASNALSIFLRQLSRMKTKAHIQQCLFRDFLSQFQLLKRLWALAFLVSDKPSTCLVNCVLLRFFRESQQLLIPYDCILLAFFD